MTPPRSHTPFLSRAFAPPLRALAIPRRRLAALAIPLILLAGLLIAPATGFAGAPHGAGVSRDHAQSAHAPSAHAASSYLVGIGDESGEMFGNPLWQQLHTKIVRYIAPYDAAAHPYSLDKAIVWIHTAEAHHQQVLVAFYHSEYTPFKLPSVAVYQRDVAKFIKLFPNVREYQAWDEANRGYIPHYLASPSAAQTARYYQALLRVCHGCTVLGLDVLDQEYIQPTLRYIAEFKREVHRLHTVMPTIWGLHNYSDLNRLESWRTSDLIRAFGGQVWLTETGGVVKFGKAFPNRHGEGLTRAARVLKFMFAVAGSHPQIKRLYIYDWTGGNSRTRFDAGLMNAHDQPRPGYVVVCQHLHGAHCDVRTVKN